MTSRLRIVVGGYIGLLPAGGVTWDYVQYPAGLAALGHDVFYVEDTRLWPIYQPAGSNWGDATASVAHLESVMTAFGLAGRWAYRDEASGRCFGMTDSQISEVCRTADVFLNVSCSTFMRDEYYKIPVRGLMDTDPMFTQIQYVSRQVFTPGESGLRGLVDAHTHHFTFGQNIRGHDCRVPDIGVNWLPTRQPVLLDLWRATPLPGAGEEPGFTTVMNWAAARPLEYDGETWGQKDVEFARIADLPAMFRGTPLTVAVGHTGGAGPRFPVAEAQRAGWRVLDPGECASDWLAYREFIHRSFGEFSVAKEAYVKARTGWFSCRSACYLAAGRPVVTQDTGWSKYLPSDGGLLPFHDMAGAIEALEQVAGNPVKHARMARRVAEECFDSGQVLNQVLSELGSRSTAGGSNGVEW